ncbi:hypothetical protein GJ744_006372 [Endocarpon pusillum]|uniref:Uncharacterized protein n=1 Tax=Endocarpon pusillum TaxID=364733 RepID=A0A8H7ANW6_9EURO|nr:hypothetical protein GJ744_006372 [Endocarpon pusillum]
MDSLIKSVRNAVPREADEDAYYLVIAAVIVASNNPAEIGLFYRHLADHVFDGDAEKAAKASSEIRDVLMKSWTLIGIPPVVTAIPALIKEDDKSFIGESVLSEKWANPPNIEHGGPISERGMAMMLRLYGTTLLPKIFDSWGSFRSDVVFLEASIIYGLHLADHSVLTEIQSECVIVALMLCTGFGAPSLWHLRGLCRLLGARGNTVAENKEVVDRVQRFEDAVKECVSYYKMEDKAKVAEWPAVADVEKQLGGFGNDEF